MMLLDCTVEVDGIRFNDGTARPPGDPDAVALSGLRVIWGRTTSVDQPAPSTCRFTVADWTGTADFLATFRIGAMVDVNAAGTDYGAPTTGTYDDPTLTRLGPVSDTMPGVTITLDPGAGGVRLDPAGALFGPPTPHAGTFRPDDPSPAVSAWVDIPRMYAGQSWTARVTGTSPYGGFVYPIIVGFATPDADPVRLEQRPALEATGAFDLTVPFTVDASGDGLWAGVQLQTYKYATWANLAARTGLASWAEQIQTWEEMGVTSVTYVDQLTPDPAGVLDVRVFSGRVTDLEAEWDDTLGALVATVTAADLTADLANRRVPAAVYPTETAADRIERVLATTGTAVTLQIAPGPGAYLIARDEVDGASPTSLIHEVATSVDAITWPATSDPTGPYLWLEDMHARSSGRILTKEGPWVVVISDPDVVDALQLDACAMLRDGLTWRQDTTDVITRVATKWLDQGVDGAGKPTEVERTEWVTDAASETVNGVRSLTVGTQLTTALDAVTIGNTIAARAFGAGWRADGMTVDAAALADVGTVDGLSPAVVLAELLDGTRRIGRPTHVTGLPGWSPSGYGGQALLYLEGGVYGYQDGTWILQLLTTDPRGQGRSARWADLLAPWTWAMFHPAVTWAALQGAEVRAPALPAAYPGNFYPGQTYPSVT